MNVLLLLFLFMNMQPFVSGQGRDQNRGDPIQQLDQMIPMWMNKYEVPGVIIAVIDDGEINWSEAYGLADVEEGIAMTTKTVCRVESISKSVTARGVMKLVEEGKVKLDDPLVQHIYSWQFPQTDNDFQSITIRQLLSHSSGLSLGTIGLEYAPDEDSPSLRESLSKEVKMIREPGEAFSYSNVGYHLLELLIEDVTGRSFSEYMQKEILNPLGMKSAGFDWSENFEPPVPKGYDQKGKPIPVYVYSEKAAGGLFANAEDIAQFVASGMANDLFSPANDLSEQSILELYKPVIETTGPYGIVSEQYGLGHFIEKLPGGQKAVFGGGQGHGWMTHFHMVPATGDGIVILTNSSRSWPVISSILGVWADGIGIETVGMEVISKAVIVLWLLNALMLIIFLMITARIFIGLKKGRRRLKITLKGSNPLHYVNFGLFILLIPVLFWVQKQDYLFLTSVFPGVGNYTLMILWLLALLLMLSVLFPKSEVTDRMDYI